MSVESAKQYRQLATKYRGYGFNLVPLGSDKRPAMTGISTSGGIMRFRWDDWQQTKQTDPLWAQIKSMNGGGRRRAGRRVGPVSGDMVCIDLIRPRTAPTWCFHLNY
ncbi:MAG: hypothetical protein IPM07_30520 [Anaerolineales bacterium]|nr:hypothetical protein [Anaerolineales bacterium]